MPDWNWHSAITCKQQVRYINTVSTTASLLHRMWTASNQSPAAEAWWHLLSSGIKICLSTFKINLIYPQFAYSPNSWKSTKKTLWVILLTDGSKHDLWPIDQTSIRQTVTQCSSAATTAVAAHLTSPLSHTKTDTFRQEELNTFKKEAGYCWSKFFSWAGCPFHCLSVNVKALNGCIYYWQIKFYIKVEQMPN